MDIYSMKYHTKSLEDLEYLYRLAMADKHNSLDLEQLKQGYREHYVLGFEIFEDDKRVGVVFALKIDNRYTIDGYNECGSIFSAVKAGKKVAKILFRDYTDVIYTSHKVSERAVTVLTKRIGFKEDLIILKMVK